MEIKICKQDWETIVISDDSDLGKIINQFKAKGDNYNIKIEQTFYGDLQLCLRSEFSFFSHLFHIDGSFMSGSKLGSDFVANWENLLEKEKELESIYETFAKKGCMHVNYLEK